MQVAIITAAVTLSVQLLLHWRSLREQSIKQDLARKEEAELMMTSRLAADDNAWERVRELLDREASRITALENKVTSLEIDNKKLRIKIDACDEERDLLRQRNELLAEENVMLRDMLDEVQGKNEDKE